MLRTYAYRFNRLKEFVENEIAEVEGVLVESREQGEVRNRIETIEEQFDRITSSQKRITQRSKKRKLIIKIQVRDIFG